MDSHLPLGEDIHLEGVDVIESDYEVAGYSICIFKAVKAQFEGEIKDDITVCVLKIQKVPEGI